MILLVSLALGANYVGDLGAVSVTFADGDTVSGDVTTTGDLVIPAGVTVTSTADAVRLQAANLTVTGTLSAAARVLGGAGAGPDGPYAYCTGTLSGGGAGHASSGGDGTDSGATSSLTGGAAYGSVSDRSADPGSGGGRGSDYMCSIYGSALDWPGEVGGLGGGAVHLVATQTLVVTGLVDASGGDGPTPYSFLFAPGGGGSGGTVLVEAGVADLRGTFDVSGGDAGVGTYGSTFVHAGGGGSGGRVKVFRGIDVAASSTALTAGGDGTDPGGVGSVHEAIDPMLCDDGDSDGSLSCIDDCDDGDPDAYPGAIEVLCDNVDQDCDELDSCPADTGSDPDPTGDTGFDPDPTGDTGSVPDPTGDTGADTGTLTDTGPAPFGDSDGDGLLDEIENDIGTDPFSADTDGDGVPDGVEVGNPTDPTDTDDDGVPDALDPDDDGDGRSTADEGSLDVDGDGVPDYLDNDSDGDGLLDVEEGDGDEDCDEVPDWQDADGTDGPCAEVGGGDDRVGAEVRGCGCDAGPTGPGSWWSRRR